MKILIIKLSALGDIVHAMVALQFIQAQHPNIVIDWLVEARFAEVLRHNPHVRHILTLNLQQLKTHPFKLWAEIKQVRKYAQNSYDLVLDVQGLLKSAITAKLLSAPLVGFDKDSIREPIAAYLYDQGINCAYDVNTIERNLKLLSEPLGFTVTPTQIQHKQAFLYFDPITVNLTSYFMPEKKNIILIIASTWASRNYPVAKFVQVAEQLQQNCLIPWGNLAEKNLAESLAAKSKYINVLPKLDLNNLKACIAQADLLIGNDTGPSHFAWACNIPSLILFGCTPISRVYQTKINKVLNSESKVNPLKLDKHDYSVREIKVVDVVKIAHELLA